MKVADARWPLDALCGFASRRNRRRGFLVVSRVLGRHLPALPATMRASARDLAALLPATLPGPVLVIGLAETAICLGATVHREWRALTGRDDLFFLHSTRQRLDAPLLCRFEEPHSHASTHLLYRPAIPTPRALVIVDDEVSTGTTLSNLSAAVVGCWPGVEAIVAATLTDWSDGAWVAAVPRPAHGVSLLQGRLAWTATPGEAPEPDGAPADSLGTLATHRNRGRLGWHDGAPDVPPMRPPVPGQRLRIIGTGEFTYPPFLLAEQLERDGNDVVVQATSRSPARLGGVIGHALRFADNYGTGVPNFLYNSDPADGRASWICYETPAGSVDPALIDALGASMLEWPA